MTAPPEAIIDALAYALKECADMLEDHYRMSLMLASKAAKDKAVSEHRPLAKARKALKLAGR